MIYKNEEILFENVNGFDLIEKADCDDTENGWFTEDTSWEYCNIKISKFLIAIKDEYGIQIEKKAVSGFYGSVKELCESLTDRVNRALEFHKK